MRSRRIILIACATLGISAGLVADAGAASVTLRQWTRAESAKFGRSLDRTTPGVTPMGSDRPNRAWSGTPPPAGNAVY